jgi:hypothetical protein
MPAAKVKGDTTVRTNTHALDDGGIASVGSSRSSEPKGDDMNDSRDHVPASPGRVVLAKRENAGIHVMLLWTHDTNAVAVLVRDDGTDDQFELSVEPGGDALDTFEHPYAYAAWRGIDYRLAERRCAA